MEDSMDFACISPADNLPLLPSFEKHSPLNTLIEFVSVNRLSLLYYTLADLETIQHTAELAVCNQACFQCDTKECWQRLNHITSILQSSQDAVFQYFVNLCQTVANEHYFLQEQCQCNALLSSSFRSSVSCNSIRSLASTNRDSGYTSARSTKFGDQLSAMQLDEDNLEVVDNILNSIQEEPEAAPGDSNLRVFDDRHTAPSSVAPTPGSTHDYSPDNAHMCTLKTCKAPDGRRHRSKTHQDWKRHESRHCRSGKTCDLCLPECPYSHEFPLYRKEDQDRHWKLHHESSGQASSFTERPFAGSRCVLSGCHETFRDWAARNSHMNNHYKQHRVFDEELMLDNMGLMDPARDLRPQTKQPNCICAPQNGPARRERSHSQVALPEQENRPPAGTGHPVPTQARPAPRVQVPGPPLQPRAALSRVNVPLAAAENQYRNRSFPNLHAERQKTVNGQPMATIEPHQMHRTRPNQYYHAMSRDRPRVPAVLAPSGDGNVERWSGEPASPEAINTLLAQTGFPNHPCATRPRVLQKAKAKATKQTAD